MKTKAQIMWETYKEAEKQFKKEYDEKFFELMMAIRGTEYRRGKEDGRNEILKEIEENEH